MFTITLKRTKQSEITGGNFDQSAQLNRSHAF